MNINNEEEEEGNTFHLTKQQQQQQQPPPIQQITQKTLLIKNKTNGRSLKICILLTLVSVFLYYKYRTPPCYIDSYGIVTEHAEVIGFGDDGCVDQCTESLGIDCEACVLKNGRMYPSTVVQTFCIESTPRIKTDLSSDYTGKYIDGCFDSTLPLSKMRLFPCSTGIMERTMFVAIILWTFILLLLECLIYK